MHKDCYPLLIDHSKVIERSDRYFTQKVDHYLVEQNFQGCVLIAKEGRYLFCRGYGFANLEHQIPCTEKTIFRLGSITKQFTAVAILQLQDQGLLNVNDPLNKYFPDYPQGDKVTIHHLLTHTSGIPNITTICDFSQIERHATTPLQAMAYFRDLPLEFACGSQYKYSDSGYIILGALIESITGTSYENYLKNHLFQPLGLTNTYVDHFQKVIPHRASGYRYNDKDILVNAEFIDMSLPHAAGSLVSNIKDLYIWDRALKENRVLSSKSYNLLFTNHAQDFKNHTAYGYGFVIDDQKHAIGHKGSIEGFRSVSYRYLEEDLTIIVLSNNERNDAFAIQADLFKIYSYWRS